VADTEEGKKQACKYNLWDTSIALNAAFFVNAAILILSASVFYSRGIIVTEIQQAHQLLAPLLGTAAASMLFAVALIASGQSSTLTGTLAGQIVMEGFLHIRIRPWVRRLITRLLAIVPAVIVIGLKGEGASYELLILSQVILSMQLPFAVIPLIQFTDDKSRMGSFANKVWVKVLAWTTAAIIVGLNAWLVYQTLEGWIESAGNNAIWLWITVVPLVIAIYFLLIYISLPEKWRKKHKEEISLQVPVHTILPAVVYHRIGVAVDHQVTDSKVLAHAQALAKMHHAEIYLFHVVEGVNVQLFGKEANDTEARSDNTFVHAIAGELQDAGIASYPILGYGRVANELIRLAKETHIDILVMGGHGHAGISDLIFGTSITKVRHTLSIPVLVVQ
jgi:manganese transport protein